MVPWSRVTYRICNEYIELCLNQISTGTILAYLNIIEQWLRESLISAIIWWIWWENSIEFLYTIFSQSVKLDEISLKSLRESLNFAVQNRPCSYMSDCPWRFVINLFYSPYVYMKQSNIAYIIFCYSSSYTITIRRWLSTGPDSGVTSSSRCLKIADPISSRPAIYLYPITTATRSRLRIWRCPGTEWLSLIITTTAMCITLM